MVIDPLEDWIRFPAADDEMWSRLESLRQRWEAPRRPQLDEHGVLTLAGQWVALSPIEARLTGILLEKFTTIVSHRNLALATHISDDVRRNSLDVQLHRLRRKLAPLGLVIRTVRRRGYVLEPENQVVRNS